MGERKTPKLGTRRIYVDLSTLRTKVSYIIYIYQKCYAYKQSTKKNVKNVKKEKKKKRNYHTTIRGGS